MFYLYTKEKYPKYIGKLGYSKYYIDTTLSGNYFYDYPEYNASTAIIVESDFTNPILIDGEVKEMTREQLCEIGRLEILKDGERYENGKITKIEIPKDFLRYHWEYPNWIDDTTDVDKVQKSLNEYLQLNNYLDGEEMKERGVFEDYKAYVNECKGYLKRNSGESPFMMLMSFDGVSLIPTPTLNLKNFFEEKQLEAI